MNEVGVTFSREQLWLLNDVIRHEGEQDRWRFPPTSLALNEQVADALLVCEQSKSKERGYEIDEYTIQLSRGDTFCIDYNVRRGMKSATGQEIGKEILMKVFQARRTLSEGEQTVAQEPAIKDVEALMAQWKERDADNDSGNDSDNCPESV